MNSSTSTLVSVVTVCRNAAATLPATAESIVRQTFCDFEWIVIDGASADSTLVALEPFRNRIAHMVSEPDRGIYDAMNKGLRLARGKYVHFLNADDAYANEQVLERIAAALAISDANMVYGNVVIWNPVSGIRNRVGHPFQRRDAARCLFPHHQAVFTRRAWAVAAGGFNTQLGLSADIGLMGRALQTLGSSQWIDLDVAVFRRGGASESVALSPSQLRDRIRALASAFGNRMAMRYVFFLVYYLPKIVVLRLMQGTKWDRAWREKRMHRQALTRHGSP